MKKILITGANSYIGTNLENLLKKQYEEYKVDVLDVKDPTWINHSFAGYDSVINVAGIAHVSKDKKLKDLYFKVNRDLAIAIAEKAKVDGAKQLVFISSMIVYNGLSARERKQGIDMSTPLKTCDYYGESKRQADEYIQKMNDESFATAVIRPPMVFGPNCKGNFPRLVKLAQKTPFFPKINNKRSMIFIDNLCQYIQYIIANNHNGVFLPQNNGYYSTSRIVELIAKVKGKKIFISKFFNLFVWVAKPTLSPFRKMFDDLYYKREPKELKFIDNEKSIILSLISL